MVESLMNGPFETEVRAGIILHSQSSWCRINVSGGPKTAGPVTFSKKPAAVSVERW
jgi:hypothetical protein